MRRRGEFTEKLDKICGYVVRDGKTMKEAGELIGLNQFATSSQFARLRNELGLSTHQVIAKWARENAEVAMRVA